jgi:hypothetical protein
MAEHMRVRPDNPYSGDVSQAPQAPGGGVAVHPRAAAVEQDRPVSACARCAVDGPADRWWERDQDQLGAFSAHAQDSVAVFFAQVADVGAGGFEDPQAKQAEHGHEREVARMWGLAGGGEQGLELQVGEPEGR